MNEISSRMKGGRAQLPPRPKIRAIALAWLGRFIAIASIAAITDLLPVALVLMAIALVYHNATRDANCPKYR